MMRTRHACLLVLAIGLGIGSSGPGAGTLHAQTEDVTTVMVADGLNRPVMVTAPEGDLERLFIVEQRGVIKILNLLTGEVNSTDFLNIDSLVTGPTSGFDERGLLGVAFPPDYMDEGFFFVHYSGPGGGNTVVSRFEVDPDDADLADSDSETVLFETTQPFTNHNGGSIAFGSDGYLYIGLGDGGSANDPGDRAQDGGEFLGKMLRIDVSDYTADDYVVPADNPFVGNAAFLDEIWAYGLRNPYRFAFDRSTGDLWIGDVGQGAQEEIDFQPFDSAGGENYGWRCTEGTACTGLTGCACPSAATLEPIKSYTHAAGRCSVTGGHIYRGAAIPDLDGIYFYADWCSDDIWILEYDGTTVLTDEEVSADLDPAGAAAINDIAGFGEDGFGEMYIVERGTTTTGQIWKIVPADIADNDCNGNAILDSVEIDFGLDTDCNANGILDSCEGSTQIVASDPGTTDTFGTFVAIDAGWAVVSANRDDDAGANAGAVYVFDRADLSTEFQKLLASDGESGDDFGISCAIDGDVLVVGARREDTVDSNAGAAYVFRYDGTTWAEEQKLTASDGAASDEFGLAVAMEGDVIVIGAPRADVGGLDAVGAAYVFRYDGTTWNEEQKLTAGDGLGFDEFAFSVGISGTRIAVGAHRDDSTGGTNTGSAYVFDFDGTTWNETQKLEPTGLAGFDEFGHSIAIGGDVVAVGSWQDDGAAGNAGSVQVFRYDGTTWAAEQELFASDPGVGDHLGQAVAISGATIVSGANDATNSAGAAYTFVFDGTAWNEVERLTANVREDDDEFGTSVAISSGAILIGAPFDDDSFDNSGSAFLFESADCNGNGIPDSCEILDMLVDDCNTNGVPDGCELQFALQPADVTADSGTAVTLSFELAVPATMDATYQWRKDLVDIPGATSATLTLDPVVLADAGSYDVVITDTCLSATSDAAVLTVVASAPSFRRGDANGDGTTSGLVDGIAILEWAFNAGSEPPCLDAVDMDDDGSVAPLIEVIYLLDYAFNAGPAPLDPGPTDCGVDPTADTVECDTPPASCP